MPKAKCNKKSNSPKIVTKNPKVTRTTHENAIKSALKVLNDPTHLVYAQLH